MTAFERLMKNTEEVVTTEELKKILEKKEKKAYIGFEPSGLAHVGWKICAEKIKDFIFCEFNVCILLADWHAYINDKLGADMERIRICGEYMKDCFEAMGVGRSDVKYVYASDYVNDPQYWEKVIRIAKGSSLARIRRAMTIMGRKEGDEEADSSRILYPMMQVADIFYLDVDVAYGGMDQRRAHMLARDIAEKYRWKKVVALHTPLLSGLIGGERMSPLDAKMSKSNPESCIFIHDAENDIRRKIKKAYCPPTEENNPVLDICRMIVFNEFDEIIIEREDKHGGDIILKSYAELLKAYISKELHPLDLKNSISEYLIKILKPVRDYFEKKPENLEKVKSFTFTT